MILPRFHYQGLIHTFYHSFQSISDSIKTPLPGVDSHILSFISVILSRLHYQGLIHILSSTSVILPRLLTMGWFTHFIIHFSDSTKTPLPGVDSHILSSTSVILPRLHYQGWFTHFIIYCICIIFIICRSPGGTPLVNRKKKLRKGTGLAPIMATALKKKFIVRKISCIYKQQGDSLFKKLF